MKKIADLVVAGAVGGALVLGAGWMMVQQNKQPQFQSIENQQMPLHQVSSNSVSSLVDLTKAAEIASPGVVHIKIFRIAGSQYSYNDPFQDFFREFFGDRYYKEKPKAGGEELRLAGSGSGVIITEDGYIATNNHVIKGADKIEVVLDDKRSFEAELIGTDPTTDLALLKVKANGLSYIRYGDSDRLKIGEWVLAVGNPFDLTSTVTAGIVSAKARSINILRNNNNNLAIESFIQTDAAVNPGNSGGALVDVHGNLVGINTAIASPTGSYAGYSFAVPVAVVKKVMEDLLQYGEVQRALLGIAMTDVTAELAKEKKLEKVVGVYVNEVRDGGAAAVAGIKEGDVILEVQGNKVNTSSALQEEIVRYRPGDKVEIKYLRDGKIATVRAVLKNKLGTTAIIEKSELGVVEFLGAELVPASDEEKRKFGIRNGVKVQKVGEGIIKEKNVPKGFIIVKVADKYVSQPSEIVDILTNTSGGVLVEGFTPQGRRAYFALNM